MSKLISAVFGSACFIWISAWSWALGDDSQQQSAVANLPSSSLTITDSEFSFSADDIFSFHQNDAMPVVPSDNLALIQQLARYLGENPERELELNGLFSPAEKNKSPYPNLGLARAKAIEKLLTSEGAPEEQLVTTSAAVQNLFMMNGRIIGGVNFIFSEPSKKVEEKPATKVDTLAKAEATPEAPPIAKNKSDGVRAFYYNKKGYKLDEANRPFLDSLRRALRKRPNETLIISGYSTKEEQKRTGHDFAEKRGMAVRRYLVDNGLRRKQIVVVSHPGRGEGEDGQRVELKVERD